MTAKDYLNQIKDIKLTIRKEQERLAELKEMAMNTGTKELKQDVVQSSIKNAGLEDSVGSYVDYEQKIYKRIEAYLELVDTIVDEIYKLNCNYKIKNALSLRYVYCLSMKDIANQMGYSFDWVRHIISQGLELFEEQYKEKLNDSL